MTWEQLADNICKEIKDCMNNNQNWFFTKREILDIIQKANLSKHEKELALESAIRFLMMITDSLETVLISLNHGLEIIG